MNYATSVPIRSREQAREAEEIRRNLRVRFNHLTGGNEVYTTVHGSGVYRWYPVTSEDANWYLSKFKLDLEIFDGTTYRVEGKKHG